MEKFSINTIIGRELKYSVPNCHIDTDGICVPRNLAEVFQDNIFFEDKSPLMYPDNYKRWFEEFTMFRHTNYIFNTVLLSGVYDTETDRFLNLDDFSALLYNITEQDFDMHQNDPLIVGDCVIFLGVGFDDENGSILQHRISISVLSGGKMISLIDSRFSNEIIFRTVDDFIDYFKLQYKRLLEVSILEPVDSRVAKEIPTLSLFKIQQKRLSE